MNVRRWRRLVVLCCVAGAGVLAAVAQGDSAPPGSRIVFAVAASNGWSIALAQPDGSNPRTIVSGSDLSPEPSLSPDRNRVAFSARAGARSSVETIGVDGTGRTRVSPRGIDAYSPSWSPDGRKIVFEGVNPVSGLTSIDVVGADGTGFSRLSGDGRDEAPDWSPDGKKIVFAARDDIYSMNADGTGRTAVTHFSGLPAGGRPAALNPRWSPDGRWILFTKLLLHPSGDDGEFTIAVIRPDGTGERQIRTTGGAPLAPRWTPDGSRIVFQICCKSGRFDVATMPVGGGSASVIARGESASAQPGSAGAGAASAGGSMALQAGTRVLSAGGAKFAAAAGPSITFTRNDLDLRPFGQVTEGNNVADIDGDGKLDIIVAGDNAIVWYHNPDWAPHLIATGRIGAGAMVLPLDVNGDGRIDIVTGSQNNPSCTEYCRTLWLENTGSDWVEHTIAETAYCHDLAVGDLNGDGRPDLVCDDQIASQIRWMQKPADPTQPWTVRLIDNRRALGNDIADIDGDGRLDVVVGRAWYRNQSSGTSWTRYAFTTLQQTCCSTVFDDFSKVNVKDVNGDGRPDVLATLFAETPLGQVWAFLAPANPYGGGWTSVQIDAGPRFSVHGQAVASFDGTSAVQFAVGETNYGGWSFGVNPSPELNVYRLDGAADQPSSWEKILVDRQGAHELRAADLDGDGLPDLTGDFENTDRLNPPTDGALHWWINTTAAGAGGAPQNVSLPAIAGAGREGSALVASTGTWNGDPASFAYQWLDCDSGGAACTAVTGAESATYVLSAGDVGGTVRVRVTATNAAGPAAATSAATGVIGIAAADGVPPGFDSVVTDAGCTGCTVTTLADGSFRAAVAGGTTDNDSAYAQLDFGGNTGLLGKTYVRTVVQLENGKSPSANLAILQERDVSGNLIYELYIAPDRTLRIYSPSGGISELGENSTTGVVVPNDGATAVRVEVAALANSSMVVRVNGVDKLTFDPLARATTGNPRFLRVGIDHYGAPATNDPISVVHASVAVTQAGWPGAPASPSAPSNIALPVIAGTASLGQILTASDGTWTNSPTSFVHQWSRCDAGGASCSPVGLDSPIYTLTAGDVGSTIRVQVTATNASGSATATSDPTAVVQIVASAPTNISAPTINGTASLGSTLTALNGSWSGSPPPTFSYEWQSCDVGGTGCTPIAGATDQSYVVQAVDEGNMIRVQVTATNASGSATATSDPTPVVQSSAPPSGGTFGTTAVGGLTHRLGGNYLEVSGPYTLASSSPVSKLTAYLEGGGSATGMRAVIYADDGNKRPGAVVAASQPVTVASGATAAWVDFLLPDVPTLPAGTYWLGLWSAKTSAIGSYDIVAGGGFYAPATYSATASPPASWPGGGSRDALSYSLYATLPLSGSTLGKTTVGGFTHKLGGSYLEVSGPYRLASTSSAGTLTAYLAGGVSDTGMRAVIYADDGSNQPGAFVAASQPLAVGSGAAGAWVDFLLPGSPTLPAGVYWLGLWSSRTSAFGSYDSVGGSGFYAPAPYSATQSPPASWPGGGSPDSHAYSLYATLGAGS